jgi:hypothetical protein
MNPLLFADWGRMNRLFTRAMWAMAAVLVCIVCIVAAAPSSRSHPTAAAVHSAPASSVGATR